MTVHTEGVLNMVTFRSRVALWGRTERASNQWFATPYSTGLTRLWHGSSMGATGLAWV